MTSTHNRKNGKAKVRSKHPPLSPLAPVESKWIPSESLIVSEFLQRRTYYVPSERLKKGATVFEADLADMLANQAVRQLCVYSTPEGWMVQALPTWKNEFLTLVSVKTKEVRRYTSLERLISAITRHGPLPPTLLIGDA